MIRIGVGIDLMLMSGVSFGNISGHLNLVAVPMPGDMISLIFPKNDFKFPKVEGFSGYLKVTQRVFLPLSEENQILITLDPITLHTTQDARLVAEFFKEGFNLIPSIY